MAKQVTEVFYSDKESEEDTEAGWYVGIGQPGCLFDSIEGPFESMDAANNVADEIEEELKDEEALAQVMTKEED
jgi:hypothetical protein